MMPPVPVEMCAPEFAIPEEALARVIARVQSGIEDADRQRLQEEAAAAALARQREAVGADLEDETPC